MLRLLVLLLVLLNAGYYAWSHDLLRAYGFGPLRQEEPLRLNQQIRPEMLVIVSAAPQPSEGSQPPVTCKGATTCRPAPGAIRPVARARRHRLA